MPQGEITFHSRNALEALSFPALGIEQCWSRQPNHCPAAHVGPRQLNEGINMHEETIHQSFSDFYSCEPTISHLALHNNLCPSDIPGHGIFCPHTEHLSIHRGRKLGATNMHGMRVHVDPESMEALRVLVSRRNMDWWALYG